MHSPHTTPKPGPEERRRWILEQIEAGGIHSQTDLAAALAARGCEVNQATLSRDLRELGAVKGPHGYAVPDVGMQAGDDPQAQLLRALREWLTEATPAQNLVVLRTPPGGAQALALALDRATPPGVVGTLAGDDTILVVCPDARGARRLAQDLAQNSRGERA